MDKRKLHHLRKQLHAVHYAIIVGILLTSTLTALLALRSNNLHMIDLRAKVTEADKSNGDIEGALRDLREYVYGHMNTNLTSGNNPIKPPIQLSYRYDRLVEAAEAQDEAKSSTIYTDAQTYCEAQFPNGLSGSNRLPCIRDYVTSHGVTFSTPNIPPELYQFDFVSPSWSPDLAGWSLVVAALSLLVLILKAASDLWFRHELHKHQ
jgi:hypothetical protein